MWLCILLKQEPPFHVELSSTFPNNVPYMSFKCTCIVNIIQFASGTEGSSEQRVFSQKTVPATLFLVMVLCEISLVKVNLCVSKHLTAVSILGHTALSNTEHR
jgi:hypothetical protein